MATVGQNIDDKNRWINVSWIPHASLSQTSHLTFSILSAQASLDELSHCHPEEWQVRVSVRGVAGLDLIPVTCSTPSAPLQSFRQQAQLEQQQESDQQHRLRPEISDATHACVWNFQIHIPLRWRDLTRDCYLLFHITCCDVLLFEAKLPLFSAYGRLHTGLKRLELSKPSHNNLSNKSCSRNPGLLVPPRRGEPNEWQEDDPVWKATRMLDQLDRLEESKSTDGARSQGVGLGKTPFGQMSSVSWLDKMTREHCETVLEEAKEKSQNHVVYGDDVEPSFLIVELPEFDVPVMHEETFYPVPNQGASGSVTPLDLALFRKQIEKDPNNTEFHLLKLVPFLDYENENDNPVEDKYRTLAHDLLRGLVDPALKPDRVQRDRLAAIIASPSHHPSREDKDLLWRFRFSLVDNRRALTKFLLAVDWTVESEVVQAAELLEQWRKRSPIEVTDALKLLGKQVAYQTNLVRAYAIDTLAAAPDDELSLYLLQLVQALKFENVQDTGVNQAGSSTTPASSLATFLIKRAAKNIQLANYLYWYLKVELQDPTHGARYEEVFNEMQSVLSQSSFKMKTVHDHTPGSLLDADGAESKFKSIVDSVSKIGHSLRGAEQQGSLSEHSSKKSVRTMWDVLSSQDDFISGIMEAQMSCSTRAKKDAKESHLRSLLLKEGYDKSSRRDPIPLPCAPDVMVNGVNPQTAKIFKSAVYPALIEFHVDSIVEKSDAEPRKSPKHTGRNDIPAPTIPHHNSNYKVIVKTGDDLRQDQLAMMMIKLMDGLLKRASLDLCLTPYSIIATSPTSGIVEFVDGSIPVSAIMANHSGSIMQFFQSSAPQAGAKYDVRPDVMARYVRSCAGYCVLTYLLGVGDRHLDNILITKEGQFFHIDFGFMFGRDPKPLPPAFRLTREMVEGMGGLESTEYRQFCSLACQAFNALRKSAGLVLNLLHLMSDAGIEDLSHNPSADAEGVIAKVEERFRLELTDEQAERFFLGLISDSLAAIAPRLMDVFHSIAVARR